MFGKDGFSLGTASGTISDGRLDGETAGDSFFGVIHSGGISKITIRDPGSANTIEVGHLQYGGAASVVPLPAALALLWTTPGGPVVLCRPSARPERAAPAPCATAPAGQPRAARLPRCYPAGSRIRAAVWRGSRIPTAGSLRWHPHSRIRAAVWHGSHIPAGAAER